MATAPKIPAEKYAASPASAPKYFINTSSEIKYKTMLINIITDSKVGKILINCLAPFFMPFQVFFLSKKKEINVTIAVSIIMYIINLYFKLFKILLLLGL